MAESILVGVVESLISKLASRAFEEASQVLGVYDHLKEFKETLSSVKVVVLEAEERQVQNNKLREWRRQIKRVLYDTQDLLDEFEFEALRKQVVKAHGTTKSKVSRFFSSSNPFGFRYRMTRQIKDVIERLDKFAAGLSIIDVNTHVVQGRTKFELSPETVSDVIGREHDKEKIIDLLMQRNTSLSVIPIVGMRGSGKTTLARFVFDDKRIHEYFTFTMWVHVSRDFDIKILLAEMNSWLTPVASPYPLHLLGLKVLHDQLKANIAGRKFLLFLDGVWNDNYFQWIELKNKLDLGIVGSKILVTTRSEAIASMMGTVPSYILEHLSQEYSLSLFVKRANDIGKGDNLHTLKGIYHLMPAYLKQCFALFSLYPKDYKFYSFEVSSLWGALGLLDSPNKNLEDAANKYLNVLQSISFLQDFVNLGSASSFEIPDLVHDLACSVAKGECLFVNSRKQNIPDSVLHLSFAENTFLDKLLTTKSVHLRTILFPYAMVEANDETILNTCVSKFKFLRILDLSSLACETLPHNIGKLKHLRYLSIRSNHNIKRLPYSICQLQNLQVLKLDGCIELEELPKGLSKLTSLRLLEITTKQFVLPNNDIASLSSLAFLCIASSHNLESIFEGVKFPSLKSLSVFDCQRLKCLPMDIKIFPELETFMVEGCGNLDLQMWKDHHEEQSSKLKLTYVHFSHLPLLVTLPQWLQETVNSLQTLVIKRCDNLEMLPEWLLTLTNLKTLVIINCRKLLSLPDSIHHLTSLEKLRIHECPELCKKYQTYVGEFWPKISHIKEVVIGEP